MDSFTTSAEQPPPFESGMWYWERSLDPWHSSAFPTEIAITPSPYPRKGGWMAIDWIENPVGFVPDGTVIERQDEHVIKMGPYGHLCAYPVESK